MAVQNIEIVRPQIQVQVDSSRPRNIVVVGSGAAVVDRFYAGAFSNLSSQFPRVGFIGVDRTAERYTKGDSLPWVRYYPAEVFRRAVQDTERKTVKIGDESITVDGAIVATRPDSHLVNAQPLVRRGIPTMIEKPLVLPSELGQIVDLSREREGRIYAADFCMDNAALQWVLQNPEKTVDRIGIIESVNGRILEPWSLETGREWLLDPEVSGGGLGMDLLPHLITMVSHILKKRGIDAPMQVETSKLGKYESVSNDQAETYMSISGHAGNVAFALDGGKGLNAWYNGITIKGSDGKLMLMTGTEQYDPYIMLSTKDGKTELYTFPDSGMGYEQTLGDFMSGVYGSDYHNGPSWRERFDASIEAVRVLKDAYAISSNVVRYEEGREIPESPVTPKGRHPENLSSLGILPKPNARRWNSNN